MIVLALVFFLALYGIYLLAEVHQGKKINWGGLGVSYFICGLANLAASALPAVTIAMLYGGQGQPDPFASELPAPVLPPMTLAEFSLKILSWIVLALLSLAGLASATQFFRQKNPGRWSAWIASVFSIAWLVCVVMVLTTFKTHSLKAVLFMMLLPVTLCAYFGLAASAIFKEKFKSI